MNLALLLFELFDQFVVRGINAYHFSVDFDLGHTSE